MRSSRPPRRPETAELLQSLLAKPLQPFSVWHVKEPDLVFGGGHRAPDPKTGLRLYGPSGVNRGARGRIRLGIVGNGETIDLARAWIDRCRRPVVNADPDVDPYLAVTFPGVAEADGLACDVEVESVHVRTLSPAELARCTADDRDVAVEATSRIIGTHLEVIKDTESPPDVVLICLPDEVKAAAGGGRRSPRRSARTTEAAATQETAGARRRRVQNVNQLSLVFFDTPAVANPTTPPPSLVSRTLHRAIKAEGMRQHIPTQVAWSSTFSGGPGRQDDATRAWNFWTAIFYKAFGAPWRAPALPANTCYVGLSFFQPIAEGGRLQTSMAQAFSDGGEGMVLRGTSFPWNTRMDGPPRMPREDAKRFLHAIVENYRKHHGRPPARVVVHKSSYFGDEERKGLEEAIAEAGVSFADFVAVEYPSVRFFRVGKEPPIRGTVIQLERRKHLVYTRGYVPFLKLYPGMRIPTPLLVCHEGGSGAVRDIVEELLALTRMNWNSADFCSAEPITLKFSRQIGLILSELPSDVEVERHFKFYM